MNDLMAPVFTHYRFHWKDGSVNEGTGTGEGAAGAASALNALGFGLGAVAALDSWEAIQPNPVLVGEQPSIGGTP